MELPRNDNLRRTHQVGVVCYDVNTNVWKRAALFTLPLEIINRYGLIYIGFTTITKALFVISDVMYMVIEYASGSPNARPPTVQILARSMVCESNIGKHGANSLVMVKLIFFIEGCFASIIYLHHIFICLCDILI